MSAEEAITENELEIVPEMESAETLEGGTSEETPIPAEEIEDHSFILSDDGASESEDRKRNAAFAKMRLKKKQAEEEARRLREGHISNEGAPTAPKAEDFLSDVVIDNTYAGDPDKARNAFLLAQSRHQDELNGFRELKSRENTQRVVQLERVANAQERFIEESQKWNIPNYETHVDNAETLLKHDADELKRAFPEEAPILLAHLGANPHKIDQFQTEALTDPIVAFANIAKLANRLKQAANEKKPKRVSTAPSETAPQGDAQTPIGDIQKRMDKAARDGKVDLYRQLKQQYLNMQRK